jgi:hypothetical protein
MTLRMIAATMSLALLLGSAVSEAQEKDAKVYELRIYDAPPGKLEALEARFRNHTTKLFEKHGMTNVGYWVPLDNSKNQLIYVLSYPSREARDQAWKAFGADAEWQRVKKETEASGKIVAKVESILLAATDYSPAVKPSSKGERVFELRTYTTTPGNLDNLHARFRNHTLKLFEKHGMTNIGYWAPLPGQKNISADNTLIYILAHKSEDAGKASFDSFRKDPSWIAARKASEDKAGGSLTTKDGVKSVYMRAADYSPIR